MKDSLLVSPEDSSSKLRRDVVGLVMRETDLSMVKKMHVAALIQREISYAEVLMGMHEASVDNDGIATNAFRAYLDEITKNVPED